MTILDQLLAIRPLAEQATPEPVKVVRYDHGGGRFFVDGDAGNRNLVADFYNEGDREFYASVRNLLTPAAIDALVECVKTLEVIRYYYSGSGYIGGMAEDALAKLNAET